MIFCTFFFFSLFTPNSFAIFFASGCLPSGAPWASFFAYEKTAGP